MQQAEAVTSKNGHLMLVWMVVLAMLSWLMHDASGVQQISLHCTAEAQLPALRPPAVHVTQQHQTDLLACAGQTA